MSVYRFYSPNGKRLQDIFAVSLYEQRLPIDGILFCLHSTTTITNILTNKLYLPFRSSPNRVFRRQFYYYT